MGLKRDATDAAYSDLIRQRAMWRCERCGKDCHDRRQGLHCAHIYGRRTASMRWHPDNAVALCYPCHRWQTESPLEYVTWLRGHVGEGLLQRLQERATLTAGRKYRPRDKEAIRGHLRAEMQRLLAAQESGGGRWVRVVGWD